MEFLDLLRAVGVGNIGLAGLVTLAVLLLLWGKIIPKSSHDARVTDKDLQIADWKLAYQKQMAINEAAVSQISRLLEYAETSNKVLTALRGNLPGSGWDVEDGGK